MLHTIQIEVAAGHPLYSYFDTVLHLGNNLYNVSLFHIRQVMTGLQKEPEMRQPNEREVLEKIRNALPKQCAQNMIRKAVADMTSYLSAVKNYHKDPSGYLGLPQLPRYKKPGGMCSMDFSNQTCRILKEKGKNVLTFAKTKNTLILGNAIPPEWILRQVMLKPGHDIFTVNVVCEDGKENPGLLSEQLERICAIDLGVSNFAAISNNAGLPAILFKGGITKSSNRILPCGRPDPGISEG